MTQPGVPASGAIASIMRAAQRLNPCLELDVDVLAVQHAAAASTAADWNAGVKTNVTPDPVSGAVRLNATTASLFSQTTAPDRVHAFHDSTNGAEEYAFDFFVDPNIAQGVSVELSSIDLYLGRVGGSGATIFDKSGVFRVSVGYYDRDWRLVYLGDPIDISANLISLSGAIYTIDFIALQRRFIFEPGAQNTNTGSGFDGSAVRVPNQDSKGISHIPSVARGLSISITPMGKNFQGAWLGVISSVAAFDTTTFWRRATNRNCGPYNPNLQPFAGMDLGHNPDNFLVTGAVPGFGAKAVTNGSWGVARRVLTAQRAQDPAQTWEQPYHNLKVKTYSASGSIVSVLDMGAVPTNDVQVRFDDWQPAGTSLAYTMRGSNISSSGAWTSIGTVVDGQVLTGANLYRWYELTAAFTPGPTGATKYATPVLQAWQMVERVPIQTYRYLKEIDATVAADPVTGQSSIAELKLPVMKVGRVDYRDLATSLGSDYSPSSLEAHVYARNTRDGARLFLNSYRLENREPTFGAEEMTFVSGMDRLAVKIPAPVETFRYPTGSGTAPATTVTNPSGTTYRIAPGGTPFTAGALNGMRMHGVTGQCAGLDYTIQSGNTTAYFEIVTGGNQTPPLSGDTFEIHSDQTTRTGAAYIGQDFAAVYADLLAVQAAAPARYRGKLPQTTGRATSNTLPPDGVKALDALQTIALHCGGLVTWNKGRIDYVDFYGRKDSVFTWGERDYVDLETPVGADRRMPSVRVKYGYQPDTQKFTNQATYEEFDTLTGWGRANLFDVFELPDDFCQWNDAAEAKYSADTFQKAWKSGVRLWKVKTVLAWPWLEQGDAGTILTDQYSDRRLSFSADGLTDLGVPVAGKTAAVAVIVGKNIWGTEFIVAVRGLDSVVSASSQTAGSVAVPAVGTQAPVAIITPDNNELTDAVWNLAFSALPGTGGGGANLTYAIKAKSGIGTDTTIASGNASSLPLDLSIARDLKVTKYLRFVVTDTATGLASTATFTVPSQRGEIDSSGRFRRGQTFDDGKFTPRANDAAGGVIDTGVRGWSDFATNNSGATTSFGVNRHNDEQLGLHATSRTFGVSFDNIPQIRALPQSFVLPGASSTVDRVIEMKAKNVTVAGYDIRAVSSTGSSSVAESETWATTLNGTPAATQTLQNLNASAFADLAHANTVSTTYTATFDVDTTAMLASNTLFVSLYKNNGTGSTSWTLVGSRSYGSGVSTTGQTISFTAAMALDWDCQIQITYQNAPAVGQKASVVVHTLTYPQITAGTETDITTAAGNGILFQAMEAP